MRVVGDLDDTGELGRFAFAFDLILVEILAGSGSPFIAVQERLLSEEKDFRPVARGALEETRFGGRRFAGRVTFFRSRAGALRQRMRRGGDSSASFRRRSVRRAR